MHSMVSSLCWLLNIFVSLPLGAKDGEEWCFTVRKFNGPLPAYTLLVNYEGFAEGKLECMPQRRRRRL